MRAHFSDLELLLGNPPANIFLACDEINEKIVEPIDDAFDAYFMFGATAVPLMLYYRERIMDETTVKNEDGAISRRLGRAGAVQRDIIELSLIYIASKGFCDFEFTRQRNTIRPVIVIAREHMIDLDNRRSGWNAGAVEEVGEMMAVRSRVGCFVQ